MSDSLNNSNFQPTLADHPRHYKMIEPLISLYQDGEASRSEQQLLDQYLSGCAGCRALLEQYEGLENQLRSYLTAIPEPHLTLEDYPFLQEARSGQLPMSARRPRVLPPPQPGRVSASSGPPSRRRRVFFSAAALGTAAALIVGIVGFLVIASLTGHSPTISLDTQVGQVNPQTGLTTTSTPATTVSATTEAPSTTESSPATTVSATTEASVTTQEAAPSPTIHSTASATIRTPAAQPTNVPPAAPPTRPVQQPTSKPQPTVTVALPTPTINAGSRVTPPTTIAVESPPSPNFSVITPSATTDAVITSVVETTVAVAVAPSTTVVPTATPTIPPTATAAPTTVAPTPTPLVPTPTPGPPPTNTPVASLVAGNTYGLIAYVDRSDKQIHLIQADGLNDQVVGNPSIYQDVVWESVVWSNDARWLAAVGLQTAKGERGIFRIDVENIRQVVYLTDGIAPVWSADSRSIAYLASANGKSGLPAVFNLKKQLATILTQTPETFGPQWFDDGARLLLGQNRVYDLLSGQTTTFKIFENEWVGASLSPFGNRLAVLESNSEGRFQTVIYDLNHLPADGGKPPVLVQAVAPIQGKIGLTKGTTRLRWTADNSSVYYYTTAPDGSYSTCLTSMLGGARCLTNVYQPSFSKDGAFYADYSLTSGLIYIGDTTSGTRPAQPHPIAEASSAPAWQPR